MDQPITFIIDTREQLPYSLAPAIRKGLPTGDYSILGFEKRVTIERKSINDYAMSIGKGRNRLKREFERMAQYKYAALVVECGYFHLKTGMYRSRIKANSAINTALSWSIRYKIPVWFVGNREGGEDATRRILIRFWELETGLDYEQELARAARAEKKAEKERIKAEEQATKEERKLNMKLMINGFEAKQGRRRKEPWLNYP
jgi:ERCC4-type nuclease